MTSRSSATWPIAWTATSAIQRRKQMWDELRALSPMHAGMSYARLEEPEGLQWPCYDEQHPGEQFLHSRLWARPVIGPRAPFSCVEHVPPIDPT